ncbi:MAG: aldehyde dehydrogenase family protein [Lachnospirales bacterium]
MDINAKDIELIVKQVVEKLSLEQKENTSYKAEQPKKFNNYYNAPRGNYGVFEKIEDAIEAATFAQKEFVKEYKIHDRQLIIDSIRRASRKNVETLAKMVRDETNMGRYEDKVEKHLGVINKTPGTECLTTDAISGDYGLMIEEYAPFGVIGSITPSTNPTETIINNTISMIAGGNAVVFNVHPNAKKASAFCLQILNKTIIEAGGPANLITMAKEPTMDNVKKIAESKNVKLMVGTGGTAMVDSLLRLGKRTIGAGAGNPPVIVDGTADLELAAKEIYRGASFDNNLLCIAEKEVYVVEKSHRCLLDKMIKEGACLLDNNQVSKLLDLVFKYENGKYDVNKEWVGKDASKILNAIGVTGNQKCKLIICDVDHNHPFVQVEQLMPVLPIVKCKDLNEAISYAVEAENGNRHTASIFSKNVDNMTLYAKEIETTIYVKNSATLSGLGIGGEGHSSMTIAGPTGEGITNAKSFTRRRRCMLADGGFRII